MDEMVSKEGKNRWKRTPLQSAATNEHEMVISSRLALIKWTSWSDG